MNFHWLNHRFRMTLAAWVILLTMPCAGMVPQTDVCLCQDCPCSKHKSERLSTKSSEVPLPCCCSENVANQPSAHQCACATGAPCRCSENGAVRVLAIRTTDKQQRDGEKNAKKSFDETKRIVTNDLLPQVTADINNRTGNQYAPHIHLPRLHLLHSVLLN